MNEIRKKLIVWVAIFLALSACQPVFVPNEPVQLPTDDLTDDYPFEDKYIYGQDAIIESLEILLLESFPLQAKVKVEGFLRDGCSELFDIKVEHEEMDFILIITTRRPSGDVACTEALVPFEKVVVLEIEGLDAGTYTVIAQDKQTEFTLDVDNLLPGQSNDGKYVYGSHAVVEAFIVDRLESFPVQINVTLRGYLPNGCIKIREIQSVRDGKNFDIQIVTKEPAVDVACTMAIVPFEETIQLDVEGLPAGEYNVRCGDMLGLFVLEQDN